MSLPASRPVNGDLLVTVEVSVLEQGRLTHVRAQHGVRGDRVTTVTTGAGRPTEIGHLTLADWPAALTTAVTVAQPSRLAQARAGALLVPWDLVLGTGDARARHRPEVYDALVARAVGCCRVGGRVLDLAGCHEELRRLHDATGRMRATGAGTGSCGGRLGIASWVLLRDRWHALVPADEGGRAMVRVEPRCPGDLAAAAATWLAAVRR